ncbi:hypothetical protein COLO4_04194 [Corchorus olitorius]|uniref:Uncharacterized protein n=1 Tax=Corchorus olitorius TaxID=93759 RepID=A0A1R3KV02_9ROSI|nr:hypothetical protein COLO4_04194 [Corchorus olitorius]
MALQERGNGIRYDVAEVRRSLDTRLSRKGRTAHYVTRDKCQVIMSHDSPDLANEWSAKGSEG